MEDFIIWPILAVLLIGLISITQLRKEVNRINSTLQEIVQRVGIPNLLTEITDEEFNKLILEGENIKAIKRLRNLTGIGLKEAKEFVDKMVKERTN